MLVQIAQMVSRRKVCHLISATFGKWDDMIQNGGIGFSETLAADMAPVCGENPRNVGSRHGAANFPKTAAMILCGPLRAANLGSVKCAAASPKKFSILLSIQKALGLYLLSVGFLVAFACLIQLLPVKQMALAIVLPAVILIGGTPASGPSHTLLFVLRIPRSRVCILIEGFHLALWHTDRKNS
jgi:hypothetical protein